MRVDLGDVDHVEEWGEGPVVGLDEQGRKGVTIERDVLQSGGGGARGGSTGGWREASEVSQGGSGTKHSLLPVLAMSEPGEIVSLWKLVKSQIQRGPAGTKCPDML